MQSPGLTTGKLIVTRLPSLAPQLPRLILLFAGPILIESSARRLISHDRPPYRIDASVAPYTRDDGCYPIHRPLTTSTSGSFHDTPHLRCLSMPGACYPSGSLNPKLSLRMNLCPRIAPAMMRSSCVRLTTRDGHDSSKFESSASLAVKFETCVYGWQCIRRSLAIHSRGPVE
ncbi:hypothetical protein F4778DRAFT_403470 [Xylariomycetidae sp. FL2044]|nr:hypothetical protein F4778DRAFT_403470 [Xylariomycetidae sp. FL2044]